jgi:hypothetical protein
MINPRVIMRKKTLTLKGFLRIGNRAPKTEKAPWPRFTLGLKLGKSHCTCFMHA